MSWFRTLIVLNRQPSRLVSMDRDEVNLGRFRFDLRQRQLKRDGLPVQLGNRARDILWVLASANGEVVSKDELMTRVWPGLAVEENNIQVHISALRKALDEGKDGQAYVITVPRRGYRLVGAQSAAPAAMPYADTPPRPGLPHQPSLALLPFPRLNANP